MDVSVDKNRKGEKVEGKSIKIITGTAFIVIVVAVIFIFMRQDQKKADITMELSVSEKQQLPEITNTTELKKTAAPSQKASLKLENPEPRLLDDKEIAAILTQIEDLKNNPSADGIKILSGYLNLQDPDVIQEVMNALAYIGTETGLDDMVFKLLEEKASDDQYPHRGYALLTAAKVGKDKLLPLVSEYISEYEMSGNDNFSRYASRALSLIGTPACIPFLNSLIEQTDDKNIHRNSLEALGRLATPEAVTILRHYLFAADVKDQASSARIFARGNNPEYNTLLADGIKNKKFQQETISVILSGKAAPEIVDSLINNNGIDKDTKNDLLKNIITGMRFAPVYVRNQTASVISEALRSYEEDDTKLKLNSIKAICQLGGEETPEALKFTFQDHDPRVRREAVRYFVNYANVSNYTDLFDMIWDTDKKTRRSAMAGIERFVASGDIPVLEKAAGHEDEFISKKAKLLLESLK